MNYDYIININFEAFICNYIQIFKLVTNIFNIHANEINTLKSINRKKLMTSQS